MAELKPCPFCKEIVYIKCERILQPLIAPLTPEGEILDYLPFEFLALPAKFCPMCGRALKED